MFTSLLLFKVLSYLVYLSLLSWHRWSKLAWSVIFPQHLYLLAPSPIHSVWFETLPQFSFFHIHIPMHSPKASIAYDRHIAWKPLKKIQKETAQFLKSRDAHLFVFPYLLFLLTQLDDVAILEQTWQGHTVWLWCQFQLCCSFYNQIKIQKARTETVKRQSEIQL